MTTADSGAHVLPPFSLLGGPLHQLGRRIGLVRPGGNSIPLGLVIGGVLWAVLVALAVKDEVNLLSLQMLGAHARLLLAIPLMFLCESAFDPRAAQFVRGIQRSGVVPRDALPRLERLITRTGRWQGSWLPDVLCLLGGWMLSRTPPPAQIPGLSSFGQEFAAVDSLMSGVWYSVVCLTTLRFLFLRWIWRLSLWFHTLWRLSRLPLHLVPSHPDGVAGLGYLEVAHAYFVPLVFSLSVVVAASFASDLRARRIEFETVYLNTGVMLMLETVIFIGPMLLFVPKLWSCRVKGMGDYMAFAERYNDAFDAKWVHGSRTVGDPLIGAEDIQAFAALGIGLQRVRDMRIVPANWGLVEQLGAAAILPMLPLLQFEYPLAELDRQFLVRFTTL